MAERGMVISLVERRRRQASAANPRPQSPTPVARSFGRSLLPVVLLVGLLAGGGGVVQLLDRPAALAGVGQLPREIQSVLFHQTLDQVRTICQHASAAIGELREHCLTEARFLLQFPACDADCRHGVAAVLPHVGR
jgi:hypothetical protein